MRRLFLLNIVIFLGVFACNLEAKWLRPLGCRYYLCSYTGDPHLTPFYQTQSYWCKNRGWELMLSNQYMTMYVLVDGPASGYAIIDYMLVFPGPPSCTTIGSNVNAWPCNAWNSPVWTFIFGNTRIYIHKTQCLIIKIVKWGRYFQIYIWQSSALIGQSCGVCIRWNCPSRFGRSANLLASEICENFIEAAQAHAISDLDPTMVEVARSACTDDIELTLDVENANVVATAVLQIGIETRLTNDDLELLFGGLNQLEQEVIWNGTMKTNDLLARSEMVCNEYRCIGSLVPTTESSTESSTTEVTTEPTTSDTSTESSTTEVTTESTTSDTSTESTTSDTSTESSTIGATIQSAINFLNINRQQIFP